MSAAASKRSAPSARMQSNSRFVMNYSCALHDNTAAKEFCTVPARKRKPTYARGLRISSRALIDQESSNRSMHAGIPVNAVISPAPIQQIQCTGNRENPDGDEL